MGLTLDVTPEQLRRLQEMDLSSDKAVLEALAGDRTEQDAETVTALGAGYQVGSQQMPPFHFGKFPLLEIIDSPFLQAEHTEFSARDIMLTVYVMFKGQAAVMPIANIARRRAAVERGKELATTPELYAVYLDKLQGVEAEWNRFEATAYTFWESLGVTNLQDVASVVIDALNQATEGLSAIPSKNDATQKKSGSTPKRLARWWRWFAEKRR